MPTDSVLRRSWVVLTGADRVRSDPILRGHARYHYSLKQRVLAVLLGIELPIPPTEQAQTKNARSTEVQPAPARRNISLSKIRDITSYEFFIKAVKAYANAQPPDRLQSRLYALESLKDLNSLISLITFERSLRGLDVTYRNLVTNLRPLETAFAELMSNWTQIRSCQEYLSKVQRHTLHEINAQVYNFTIEYSERRRRFIWSTDCSAQPELYLHLLEKLRSSLDDTDQFQTWRSHLIIKIDPHVYERGSAIEIIQHLESENESPEQRLEDARDALAVASHDFTGADLRNANLEDVPLGGIRWNRATLWPNTWFDQLRSLSVEVEPGILQVNDRYLSGGISK